MPFLLLTLILLVGCAPVAMAAPAGVPAASYNAAIALANQGKIPDAIRQLEALSRQYPQDARVKRNLVTLYYNAAAQAASQENIDSALTYAKAGLAIDPKDGQLGQLTALLLFQQGKQRLDDSNDYPGALTLMEQARTFNPSERAITEGMANTQLRWANQLKLEHKTSDALTHAKAALALNPQSASIQHSVANLYLMLAQEAKDPAQRKQYFDQALAADPSPELKATIAQLTAKASPLQALKKMNPLANPAPLVADSLHPFLAGEAPRLSSQQQLAQLARLLNCPLPPDASLDTQLSTLETAYYGQPQTGPLRPRQEALYTAVAGDSANTITASADYLPQVLTVTHGKVARFRAMPIRVYVEPPDAKGTDREGLPSATQAALEQALIQWRTATLGYVDYLWVNTPEATDVRIEWKNDPYQPAYSTTRLAETQASYGRLKDLHPSKLGKVLKLASGLAPGYFGLIPQVGAVAADYHLVQAAGFLRKEATITLPLAWVRLDQPGESQQLTNVMVQEMGRILGLKAMAPMADSLTRQDPLKATGLLAPSRSDLATLRRLYLKPVDLAIDRH